MKEIEKMKQVDIEREIENYHNFLKEREELKEELSVKYGNTVKVLRSIEYTNYYNKNIYYFNVYRKGGSEAIKKDIENHYKKLQAKVEKKIGKILEISETTNGYNYRMKGENGSCEVEVILAGGYNIQRLHTRWIIK